MSMKNVSKKCSYILSVSLEFSFTWRRHHCRFRAAIFYLYLQTLCSDYLKPATPTVARYTHSFGHPRGPVTPASIKQKIIQKNVFFKNETQVIFDVICIYNRFHLSFFQNNDRTCFCETQ